MSILSPIGRLANLILSPQQLGMVDFIRRPHMRESWGGPFNGQEGRQSLFLGIIKHCSPAAIVETGAYLGTSTEFMAKTGLQVFTVEGHPRNYGYCKARFSLQGRNVKVLLGDSRVRLKEIILGPLKERLDRTLLFYLDAHWNEDLPLAEEIEIVYTNTRNAIALIDDFSVPGDAGYAYDDYGPGKALCAAYVEPLQARFGLTAYYPSIPSTDETGLRRGCVALARDDIHGVGLRAAGFRTF